MHVPLKGIKTDLVEWTLILPPSVKRYEISKFLHQGIMIWSLGGYSSKLYTERQPLYPFKYHFRQK